MNNDKKNNKSLLQQFIDLLARIFFIKRKEKKEKQSKTDDIYPLWWSIMINALTRLKNKPFNILIFIVIIFLIFLIFSYLVGSFIGDSSSEKLIIFLITFLILIVIAEFLFLFLYRLYKGSKYIFIKKIPFEKLYVEPHPYLRFIYNVFPSWPHSGGIISKPVDSSSRHFFHLI